MKANELMIGNLVHEPYSGTMIVHSISGDTQEAELSNYRLQGIGLRGLYTLDSISPITLTPEWLERFGFEMDDSLNQAILNDHWFLGNEGNYKSWYLIRRDTNAIIKRHVTTVHQLQNLYFALTGKHLEIK